MPNLNTLGAADLFVQLDRAFRRKTRVCRRCAFSLPFRLRGGAQPNWSVIPSEQCPHHCLMILEDLLAEFQSAYRLSDTGRFHAVGQPVNRARR
jgi:hypothetical protein